jgi:hypothetical protein
MGGYGNAVSKLRAGNRVRSIEQVIVIGLAILRSL